MRLILPNLRYKRFRFKSLPLSDYQQELVRQVSYLAGRPNITHLENGPVVLQWSSVPNFHVLVAWIEHHRLRLRKSSEGLTIVLPK